MPHYYDQPHMKMIKHGFIHEHDKVPHFPDCPFRVYIDDFTRSIDVEEMSIEKEMVLMKTKDDEVRVFPGQLHVSPCEIYGWLIPLNDYVAEHAHALPAMFQYMLDNYKDLGFHPGKTPNTIALIRDLCVHLLRPMEADCPNERMQEGVKEILWHVDKHTRKGDYIALRHIATNDLVLAEVVYFDKNLSVLRVQCLDTPHLVDVHFADTSLRIEKYFGVERWAYPNKAEALIAARHYLAEYQHQTLVQHTNF